MKKIIPIVCISTAFFLISCGRKNLDTVTITPDTPIENKSQSAKVCEPVIKYLECAQEKSSDTEKEKYKIAIKNTQRKIANDDPAKVAQECSNMVKVLTEKTNVPFKEACFVAPIVPTEEEKTPEIPQGEIIPPPAEAVE